MWRDLSQKPSEEAEAESGRKPPNWNTGLVASPYALMHILYKYEGTILFTLYVNKSIARKQFLATSHSYYII